MKQLIARIDEDLHARVKQKAAAQGRSVNALVTEALEQAVPREETPQEWLERRAAEVGIELLPATGPRRTDEQLDELIEGLRGVGPFIDELLEEDRGPHDGLR